MFENQEAFIFSVRFYQNSSSETELNHIWLYVILDPYHILEVHCGMTYPVILKEWSIYITY